MEVKYAKAFLKDMKKLKYEEVYPQVFALVFSQLPAADSIKELSNIKPMIGYLHRYRIRIGNYRIGIQISDNTIEVLRVLHRQEFYRYFP